MQKTAQQLAQVAREDLAEVTERMDSHGVPVINLVLKRATLATLLSINHHLHQISMALEERAKWDSVL